MTDFVMHALESLEVHAGEMLPTSELFDVIERTPEVDEAIWHLVAAGKLAVHQHQTLGLLSAEQRANLIWDGDRAYHALSRRVSY